ncbi:MAG TPA: DUF1772 domain-containing protein [Candidatus Kapabacteria bacterium]
MGRAKELLLFITLICWGTLIGGVMYSHVVYFPPYLSHLPESTALINGPFGLHDENFWMFIHPLAIVSIIATLIFNWKLTARRKYILITMGIYAVAIIATAAFFLPELMEFANSSMSSVPASEWLERGQRWQYLSWIRGASLYVGFVMLLIAFKKND